MFTRKPKTVRCVHCGYLCTGEVREHKFKAIPKWTLRYEELYHELPLRVRSTKTLFNHFFTVPPVCFRQAVNLQSEADPHWEESEGMEEKYWEVINRERSCRYFAEYTPGHSPLQHREHQESARRARMERLWNLGFLLIGAAITLLATWLAISWG